MRAVHVIDQQGPIRRRVQGVNVPATERIASTAAGAALAFLGARVRGVGGGLLAALGTALVARGVSGRCPAYRSIALRQGIEVRRSVTVQRSRREVYAALRELRHVPRFMTHVVSVEEHGRTADWVAEIGPARLAWTTELVDELPDLRLSWRSVPGGDLQHEGAYDLEDAPGRRGTTITLSLRFDPPGGPFGAPFHGLVRAMTSHQLATDLIRLRQLLETGEVATGVRRADELHGAELHTVGKPNGHANGTNGHAKKPNGHTKAGA